MGQVEKSHAHTIDLAGAWSIRLDPEDRGEARGWMRELGGIAGQLPGITSEARLGHELDLEAELTGEVMLSLHQRRSYVGAAWYSRGFSVPENWTGGDAILSFERVIWQTRVWVNGKAAGTQDSLSAPHRYSVGPLLTPGRNLLVVEVDNRPIYDIGTAGHAYTNHTQTIWNGLIGELKLELLDTVSIEALQPSPTRDRHGRWNIRLALQQRGQTPLRGRVSVEARLVAGEGKDLPGVRQEIELMPGRQELDFALDAGEGILWSEFSPALYELEATVETGDTVARARIVSGLRTIQAEGKEIRVNGVPTFFRGTLECSIAPRTGYPATESSAWEKMFNAARAYGLNHIRFHSWCPPEAAFAAADRLGVYLQVELPNWTFRNGQDERTDAFLRAEGERIFQEYGHHPSFVLMSMGNELEGDFSYLDALIESWRSTYPHVLYTSTTYSFSPRGLMPGPQDDYFVTQRSSCGWVRGQGFLNSTWPSTDSDYGDGLACIDVPVITHEVGQYNVFPNLAEIPKYEGGNLRPLNFEAIRADIADKGRLEEAPDYTLNSGKLAVLLYKEDIERALRTRGLSGIQLLDLHDFPGQSTATIGILDAFWESKGLVTLERFREFCSPITPLLRMPKLAWTNDEEFNAEIEVSNFSGRMLTDVTPRWQIRDGEGGVLGGGSLPTAEIGFGNGHRLGTLRFDLSSIQKASQLEVVIELEGTEAVNRWSIWVYPREADANDDAVTIIRRYGPELLRALSEGRRVLFLPAAKEIRQAHSGRFIPVFWSPLHFPDQSGSIGTMIDSEHPSFGHFPTETHTDWQWWELLAESTSVNTDTLGADFRPIMRFIDKYNRNSLCSILFEAKVGPGRLLVCTLDVSTDLERRIVARHLRRSLIGYVGSAAFDPAFVLQPERLDELFTLRPYEIALTLGNSDERSPIENAMDGDPATLWQGKVEGEDGEKALVLSIEMEETFPVEGLRIFPRQKENVGRFADYRVEARGPDGEWDEVASGRLPDSGESQTIPFGRTVRTSALQLTVLSEVEGRPFRTVAEIQLLFPANTPGVDELGIVEGFNDGGQKNF